VDYVNLWAVLDSTYSFHGGDDLSNKEKSTTFAADSGIRNSVGGLGYGSTLILLLDQ
jgi:hypothetical protein